MASDYRIIANGTTIYLNNSNGVPTSGGSAQGPSTTPWMLRSPEWTVHASVPETLFTGGPPFRNGSSPVSAAYPNVTETIPLVLNGGTHDTLVARLQQLRQLTRMTPVFSQPILYAQPSGATNPVYFEILAVSCQERAADGGESPGEGATFIHVDLTITHSALGGVLSAGETLLNAVAYTNTGTGTPDNIAPYNTGSGDLIYEGGPLNIKIASVSDFPDRFILASVLNRACDVTAGLPGTYATSSTTGAFATVSSFTTTAFYTRPRLKLRILMRFSAVSANAQVRLGWQLTGGSPISFPTDWITPPASACLVDAGIGPVPDVGHASRQAGLITFPYLYIRSTNGASASVTLSYFEYLLYYDFCTLQLSSQMTHTPAGDYVLLDSFAETFGAVALPHTTPSAAIYTSTDNPGSTAIIRGRIPRYFSGASLYAAWAGLGVHSTTATATITATHAPLYQTLRGGG